MDLLLIGGVSGSGKSVALTALEDGGYYTVSHLPPAQLDGLLAHLKSAGIDRVAVVLDFKTGRVTDVGAAIESSRREGWTARFLYLDARTDTLVKRFAETRRRHPFATGKRSLTDAIEYERSVFEDLRLLGYSIDTSELSAGALRTWIKDFVSVDPSKLTLAFQDRKSTRLNSSHVSESRMPS